MKSSTSVSRMTREKRQRDDEQAEHPLQHKQHQSHVAVFADPGDDERAQHRAGAGKRHQLRIERDILIEDVLDDHRQKCETGKPRNAVMNPMIVSVTSGGWSRT